MKVSILLLVYTVLLSKDEVIVKLPTTQRAPVKTYVLSQNPVPSFVPSSYTPSIGFPAEI